MAARDRELLERKEVKTPHFGTSLRSLAKSVEKELGYTALSKIVRRKTPLAKALKKLEISPYDLGTVNQYKDEIRERVQEESGSGYRVRWTPTPLASYTKPVPEFALRKALQIKKLVPDVQFAIEELNISKFDPDPFLIASAGDELYYIEVWDEPKFENKLIDAASESIVGGTKLDDDESDEDYDDEESDSSASDVEAPVMVRHARGKIRMKKRL